MANKGIDYLRNKLNCKRTRALVRQKYYDMKNGMIDLGISSPDHLKYWHSSLGWCAKAVDSLADRLILREFKNDQFGLNDIYNLNNPDILSDAAIKEALITSCAFIYISEDETGFPRMQAISGADATGVLDPITYLLKEGYAVLERDDNDHPTVEAYFEPKRTTIYRKGQQYANIYNHSVNYPLLVPIINKPDSKRPFGRSHITRACMEHVKSALRTIKRSEISAEFYSFPQKYVNGLAEDAELDKWKTAMSWVLQITKDEDGDKPQIGQFTQQSMEPHTTQLRMFASLFAGEVGLTLDDMGFSTGNPASEQAIKAAHENLRLSAMRAQRSFGVGFLNAGYLARCLADDFTYERSVVYMTKPVWEPVFEPDAAMLSSIGDSVIKINQAIPGYFNVDNLSVLTGIEASALPVPVQNQSEAVNG